MGRALAVLVLGAGLGLALAAAGARATEMEGEGTETQPSEVRETTQPSPLAQQLLEKRERRYQRQVEWWAYTREALLADLELSPEQAHEIDVLIETQLSKRARLQEIDTELEIARDEGAEGRRIRGLRNKRRALQAQLLERHEVMEAMRALLTEEQRPTFDMNRARLVSERKPPKPRGAPTSPPSPSS